MKRRKKSMNPRWRRRAGDKMLVLGMLAAAGLAGNASIKAGETTLNSAVPMTTASVGGAPTDIRMALDEMSRLERQLELQRSREHAARLLLQKTSATLEAVSGSLEKHTALEDGGAQAQQNLARQRATAVEAYTAAIARQHGELEANRNALQPTLAALYYMLNKRDGASVVQGGLAGAAARQHDAVEVATQQLLRAEQERGAVLQEAETAADAATAHSTFASYTLAQLRERHAELAEQVGQWQKRLETEGQTTAQLDARRAELRGLVARLISQETAATPTPAGPEVAATPAPAVSGASANAPVLPQLPDAGTPQGGQQAISEVPYEAGSEPLVSEVRPAPAAVPGAAANDASGASTTRRIFWRATPVGVRALLPGRVVFAKPFAGYRMVLILDHGQGWRTLMGNITASQVQEGDSVKAGQLVGAYQAAAPGEHAEAMWIEFRQGVSAVAPEACPLLSPGWENQLFAAQGRP
jgi:septal ring factor EnvC (AmiA/AmiB activator)